MFYYQEYTPCNALRPFIECLWILKSSDIFSKRRELIISGGRVEMLFIFNQPITWFAADTDVNGVSYIGPNLMGQRNKYFFIEYAQPTYLLGVRFRHGGFTSFTKIPLVEFLNGITPLSEIFGNADLWMEQLSETDSENKIIDLMQQILLEKLHVQQERSQAIQLITLLKQSGDSSIQNICRQTGIHYKKLERTFNQYTGYNPKNFLRIVRFYRTLKGMLDKKEALTSIGLNEGYYDQAHFINDFKQFTGKAPGQFKLHEAAIAQLLLQSKHV
jgi:AraC-like DNA-binding protein